MGQNIHFRHQTLLYYIAAASITLDQYTKHLVRSGMVYGETMIVHAALRNIFDLTHTTNTGAAFGIFQGGSVVFTVIAIVVAAAIIYFNWTLLGKQRWLRVALGLQMGGAVGNLIDRLRFGTVTDFLHVHYWPVFNVADSSITVGVVILAVLMFSEIRRDKQGRDARERV